MCRSWGAVCAYGYYLVDGDCRECGENGYCVDDIKYDCPQNSQDLSGVADGMILYRWQSFSRMKPVSSNIYECIGDTYIGSTGGEYLAECRWNDENYYKPCDRPYLWYKANLGYYLTGYLYSSWYDWYEGVKPCTNKPANSHYISAGTPEGNNCSWECDDGFAQYNDLCWPLCATGVQYIKTSSGISVPLFSDKLSQPALCVEYNNGVCYAVLELGEKNSAINIIYNGVNYHAVAESN